MLLPCMKWSLATAWRNVGEAELASKLCAKKTFQSALSLLTAEELPYQAIPTEPGVGPVSIQGKKLDFVSGPSLTRTRWLQVSPLSVELRRKTSFPSE